MKSALLCDLGEYEKAAQCIKETKGTKESDLLKKVSLNLSEIGKTYECLNKTNEAIIYYRKALETYYPLPETSLAFKQALYG